jgi:hypothetical protein
MMSTFWDIKPRYLAKTTDVSEEYTASIFMVDENARQIISMKKATSNGSLPARV